MYKRCFFFTPIWIGSQNAGMVHVHNGRPHGLSSEFLSTFFEDATRDIWIATSDCLDGFREVAVPTVSVRQGLLGREFNVRGARHRAQARRPRGLHDTLKQSFQGVLIEFRGARNLFARRSEGAMHALDGAISIAESAITEGRDGVQNLRSARSQSCLQRLRGAPRNHRARAGAEGGADRDARW